MDELTRLFEESIVVKNVGTIHFPTVKDLISLKEDTLNKYISPYRLSLEILDLPPDVKKDMRVFDLFFISELKIEETNESYFEVLLQSLKFYFKEDVVYDDVTYTISIGNSGKIHRNNFDEVADIILAINSAERIKIEEPPVFQNERQKDIYYKLMAGRRRKAINNKIDMSTILNTVVHGGKSFISYDEVKKLTVNQLLNSYKAILDIDSFFINYDQYLVGVEPKKLDLDHWSKKMVTKINKELE